MLCIRKYNKKRSKVFTLSVVRTLWEQPAGGNFNEKNSSPPFKKYHVMPIK